MLINDSSLLANFDNDSSTNATVPLQTDPLFRNIFAKFMISAAILSLVVNTSVLWRLHRIVKRFQKLRPAFALQFMCSTDMVAVGSLLWYQILSGRVFGLNLTLLNHIYCKVIMLAIHTAASFSVWCFVVMSFTRCYMFLFPFDFRNRKWLHSYAPLLGMALLACAAMESWMLIAVKYDPRRGSGGDCSTSGFTLKTQTGLFFADVCWTFILPLILTGVLDLIGRMHQILEIQSARRSIPVSCATSVMAQTAHLPVPPSPGARSQPEAFIMDEPSSQNSANSAAGVIRGKLNRLMVNIQAPNSKRSLDALATVESMKKSKTASSCRSDGNVHVSSSAQNGGPMQPLLSETSDQNGVTNNNTERKNSNNHIRPPVVAREPTQKRIKRLMSEKKLARTKRSYSLLKRYLLLTWVKLLLMVPHVLNRTLTLLGIPMPLPRNYWMVFAYMTYYGQFSMNWLYLWVLYPTLVDEYNDESTRATVTCSRGGSGDQSGRPSMDVTAASRCVSVPSKAFGRDRGANGYQRQTSLQVANYEPVDRITSYSDVDL